MSTSSPTLDPAIANIILDVQQDPQSRIFYKGPRWRGALAAEQSVAVTATMPGLRPAERELLSVYREETAGLLREAFLIKFCSDKKLQSLYRPERGALTAESWQAAADREVDSVSADGRRLDSVLWLELCRGGSPEQWPSAIEIARASLRLVDCDQARIYYAVACLERGELWSAERILAAILNRRPSRSNEGYTILNLALARVLRKDLRQALELTEYSQALGETLPRLPFNFLVYHLDAGDLNGARYYAQEIDERHPPSDPEIAAHIDGLEVCFDLLSPEADRVPEQVKGFLDGLGESSRRIIHARFQAE